MYFYIFGMEKADLLTRNSILLIIRKLFFHDTCLFYVQKLQLFLHILQ